MSYRVNFEEFCQINDEELYKEYEKLMPCCTFECYCQIRHKWPRESEV